MPPKKRGSAKAAASAIPANGMTGPTAAATRAKRGAAAVDTEPSQRPPSKRTKPATHATTAAEVPDRKRRERPQRSTVTEEIAQEIVADAPSLLKKGRRRGAKLIAEVEVGDDVVTIQLKKGLVPAQASDVEDEEAGDAEPEASEQRDQARRGRPKRVTADEEVVEEPVDKIAQKPKRGRGRGKAQAEEATIQEDVAKASEQPRRGRGRPTSSTGDKKSAEHALATSAHSNPGYSLRRKGHTEEDAIEDAIEEGRRNALTEEEYIEEIVEEASKAVTPHRGRSNKSTAKEETPVKPVTEASEHPKRGYGLRRKIHTEEDVIEDTIEKGRRKALTDEEQIEVIVEEAAKAATPHRGRPKKGAPEKDTSVNPVTETSRQPKASRQGKRAHTEEEVIEHGAQEAPEAVKGGRGRPKKGADKAATAAKPVSRGSEQRERKNTQTEEEEIEHIVEEASKEAERSRRDSKRRTAKGKSADEPVTEVAEQPKRGRKRKNAQTEEEEIETIVEKAAKEIKRAPGRQKKETVENVPSGGESATKVSEQPKRASKRRRGLTDKEVIENVVTEASKSPNQRRGRSKLAPAEEDVAEDAAAEAADQQTRRSRGTPKSKGAKKAAPSKQGGGRPALVTESVDEQSKEAPQSSSKGRGRPAHALSRKITESQLQLQTELANTVTPPNTARKRRRPTSGTAIAINGLAGRTQSKPTAEASGMDTNQMDIDAPVEVTRSYWLMKAEPNSRIEKGVDVKFSIDDLRAAAKPEPWEGVRNHVAKNNMMAMKSGDLAFFYHSSCKVPGIAGIMEVVQESSVDESAFDPNHPYYDAKSNRESPKWHLVHVEFRRKFSEPITLKELQSFAKPGGALENMQLLKQLRLSVSKVDKKEWDFIMRLVDDNEASAPEASFAAALEPGPISLEDAPTEWNAEETAEQQANDDLNVESAIEAPFVDAPLTDLAATVEDVDALATVILESQGVEDAPAMTGAIPFAPPSEPTVTALSKAASRAASRTASRAASRAGSRAPSAAPEVLSSILSDAPEPGISTIDTTATFVPADTLDPFTSIPPSDNIAPTGLPPRSRASSRAPSTRAASRAGSTRAASIPPASAADPSTVSTTRMTSGPGSRAASRPTSRAGSARPPSLPPINLDGLLVPRPRSRASSRAASRAGSAAPAARPSGGSTVLATVDEDGDAMRGIGMGMGEPGVVREIREEVMETLTVAGDGLVVREEIVREEVVREEVREDFGDDEGGEVLRETMMTDSVGELMQDVIGENRVAEVAEGMGMGMTRALETTVPIVAEEFPSLFESLEDETLE